MFKFSTQQKVGYQNHDALDTGKHVFPHNIHNPSQGSVLPNNVRKSDPTMPNL